MVKIKWLKSAKDDLKEIYDFIAKDSKKYASHQIKEITEKTNLLKTHPKAGKIVKELNDSKIREITSGNYRIFYSLISDDIIHILLIHHGARRFPRIKNK